MWHGLLRDIRDGLEHDEYEYQVFTESVALKIVMWD